jgi:hypothetical protein
MLLSLLITNGQVTVSMIKESKQFIFLIKDNAGVGISQEKK